MKIRFATPDDAMDIADVHIQTWRSTYRGIVPDSYLDNLSLANRGNYWRENISNPPKDTFVLVDEEDTGEIVGFVTGGPPRPERSNYQGELYAIYVLAGQQGKGIGRRLVQATAREMRARGMTSMLLWVFKDNEPSRRFYESMGGRLLNEQQFELGGATLTEVGYGWQDISTLSAAK